MKKIFFFYHHFGGLGHGMRIVSLCKAIKRNNPEFEILVANSGEPQPELAMGRYAHVVNLPYFKAKEGLFRGLKAQGSLDATFRRRRRILDAILERFTPDCAVFEHFPFGRESLEKELLSFMEVLRRRGIPIYSSVRDVIVQKIKKADLLARLAFFNAVLVHSDKEMGFVTSFKQGPSLKAKMVFTGRVAAFKREDLHGRAAVRKRLNCGRKKLILASFGGGIDARPLLDKVITSKEKVGERFNCLYLLTAGPAVKETPLEDFRREAKRRGNILIKKFIPAYTQVVHAADLSISMGGYNAVNDALLTGTKSLILPRQTDDEQKTRSRHFRRYFDVMDAKDAAPESLARRIERSLTLPRKSRYQGDFNGADFTARFFDRALALNFIKIRLTTRCNCRCAMCSWRQKKQSLSFSQVKKILDQARLLNVKVVNFTGGEPTLTPHFRALAAYAKKQGLRLSVSTNGDVSRKSLEALGRFCDDIDVSIDSQKEKLNDLIRGKKGVFKRSLKTIHYCAAHGKRVSVNVTVRPDNFRSIHEMVALLAEDVRFFSFTLVDNSIRKKKDLCFTKKELIAFYMREVPLILKACVRHKVRVRITPFFKECDGVSAEEALKKMLSDLHGYRRRLKSVFTVTSSGSCPRAANGLRINADGRLSPCCYLDDHALSLGNIRRSSLIDLVTSEGYARFIKTAVPGQGLCRACRQGTAFYQNAFD